MDTVTALEGACLGINLQIQALEYLEPKPKNSRLIQVLSAIRSILNFFHEYQAVEKLKTTLRSLKKHDDVDAAKSNKGEDDIRIQKLFSFLTRIRHVLDTDTDASELMEPITAESENYFDSQCIGFVKFIISSFIDNNSAFKHLKETEIEVNASDGENYASHRNRKRKIDFVSDDHEAENDSATVKEQLVTLDNSCKKPKPKSPMEAALETDLILMEIFRHSAAGDLKQFRRVNHKWNENVTSVLLSKKSLRIVLNVIGAPFERPFYQTEYLGAADLVSFKDLGTLMESSSKFPSTSLVLRGGKPHEDIEFKEFLSKNGHYFKEFLMRRRTNTVMSFLYDLLETYAPNVEIFEVEESEIEFHGCDKEDMSISPLPNLKKLVFKPRFKGVYEQYVNFNVGLIFFNSLLTAAVNLQSVETIVFNYLEEVMNTNKHNLIQKFQYDALQTRREEASENNVAIVDRLINLNVKLTRLVISFSHVVKYQINTEDSKATVARQLNSILNASNESLISLEIEALGAFPGIYFPQLPNLVNLSVKEQSTSTNNTQTIALFPPTFSFSEHMPNLRKIRLSLKNFQEASLQTCFPGDKIHMVCTSARYLNLEGCMFSDARILKSEMDGAKLIPRMFPNIKSLRVQDKRNIDAYRMSRVLWHLCPDKLKSLEICGISCTGRHAYIPIMDSVDAFFNGFSEKVCKVLREQPVDRNLMVPEVASLVNQLRSQRSLYDLKELEELNMFFTEVHSSMDPPFTSHVTGTCTFGLMPKLKVTVTHSPKRSFPGQKMSPMQDIGCWLEPIASYIRIVRNQPPQ